MTAQLNRRDLTAKPHKPKPEAYNRTIEAVAQWSQEQLTFIRENLRRHAPEDHHVMYEMLIDDE